MAIVLTGLGIFLHARLGTELLRGIDLELRSRAGSISTALREPTPPPIDNAGRVIDPDESFAQVLSPAGTVLDSSRAVRTHPLLPAQKLRGLTGPTFRTGTVPGGHDPARLLAVPAAAHGRPVVVVVGSNLGDRNEALSRLQLLLVLGIPVALLLASGVGWLVAGAALRPVEQIRREAAELSDAGPDRRLTVPDTGDELARLADTLNQMLTRQYEARQREHRFLDEASHDLRTPLAVLKAELDLATARPRSRAELTAAVHTAAEMTDRLVELAEDLLVLARRRSGPLPLQREPVSLRRMLQDSVSPLRSSGCVVEAPADEVYVDPARIRQALRNAVDNALRYGAGTPVVISGERRDGEVVVTVTDTGPGFPPDLLGPVFEPARRNSTGLGLAIIGAVAEAHAGHAKASNRPGGGAQLRITIPG
jgi:signal transduction histidine kinase